MQNDTIAAIATPPGIGGIGIIRVSGPEAFATVLPLLQRPGGCTDQPPSHMLTYGHIVNPTNQEVFDEVLVAFMCAPHTYTRAGGVEKRPNPAQLTFHPIFLLVRAKGAGR